MNQDGANQQQQEEGREWAGIHALLAQVHAAAESKITKLKQLEGQHAQLAADIRRKDDLLAARDHHITQLRANNAQLEERLAVIMESNNKNKNRITELEKERDAVHAAAESEITKLKQLEGQHAQLAADIRRKDDLLAARGREIVQLKADLQRALAQRDDLKSELDAKGGSSSRAAQRRSRSTESANSQGSTGSNVSTPSNDAARSRTNTADCSTVSADSIDPCRRAEDFKKRIAAFVELVRKAKMEDDPELQQHKAGLVEEMMGVDRDNEDLRNKIAELQLQLQSREEHAQDVPPALPCVTTPRAAAASIAAHVNAEMVKLEEQNNRKNELATELNLKNKRLEADLVAAKEQQCAKDRALEAKDREIANMQEQLVNVRAAAAVAAAE